MRITSMNTSRISLNETHLSLSQHFELKDFCDEIGVTYLCTPFSLKAAQEVADLLPFFKIGSGEFQDRWFIDGLAELGKPVIFSLRYVKLFELKENVEYLKQSNLDFSLLN